MMSVDINTNTQFSQNYLALLDQIKILFARHNLTNNTYLFKHMSNDLTLPFYAIVEEKKVAQITTNQQHIRQAIEESQLAKVIDDHVVGIIDYPTIKMSCQSSQYLHQVQALLKQKKVLFSMAERVEREYVNLTVYSESITKVEELLSTLDHIKFERVNLYDDIKAGVSRIKKLKGEKNMANNHKAKYSLDKPPQIFIRRAVSSSDEEENAQMKAKQERKKKYKQVVKEKQVPKKPLFDNDDFPSLN